MEGGDIKKVIKDIGIEINKKIIYMGYVGF